MCNLPHPACRLRRREPKCRDQQQGHGATLRAHGCRSGNRLRHRPGLDRHTLDRIGAGLENHRSITCPDNEKLLAPRPSANTLSQGRRPGIQVRGLGMFTMDVLSSASARVTPSFVTVLMKTSFVLHRKVGPFHLYSHVVVVTRQSSSLLRLTRNRVWHTVPDTDTWQPGQRGRLYELYPVCLSSLRHAKQHSALCLQSESQESVAQAKQQHNSQSQFPRSTTSHNIM